LKNQAAGRSLKRYGLGLLVLFLAPTSRANAHIGGGVMPEAFLDILALVGLLFELLRHR
jgi:hypothetical protein